MDKKLVSDFIVNENIPLNTSNSLLRLEAPLDLPDIKAGQFVNIDIKNCNDIFLRRPFSVFDADYNNNFISIIVKILGRGSKKLAEMRSGELLNLIFPLGKGFTYPSSKDEKILMVGGGSGVAPLLFLAKESGLPAENVDIIIGARSCDDHFDVEDYKVFGCIHHTTEDGTFGYDGMVTDHPIIKKNLCEYDKIYACGPDAMMKAVAGEAKKRDIFCEVSLENMMACGFGVCLCCIEPTVSGNLCACIDGPVFNINDLKWQI